LLLITLIIHFFIFIKRVLCFVAINSERLTACYFFVVINSKLRTIFNKKTTTKENRN